MRDDDRPRCAGSRELRIIEPRDHAHMARALQLAARGRWTARPNPMVGCVIAHGERIVGEGWHERAGQPHAEVHALAGAGEAARGADAYVTLEPCAHHGRTPPCADALLAAGIGRVWAATGDPFEQVAGAGAARLRDAGVPVHLGLMEARARELNRGFFSRIERGRPWLRLKLAVSLDGRTALADGESRWISSEASRLDVARWRADAGAVLTGIGTALADDPRLTVRLPGGEAFAPPLRVVLDSSARMYPGLRLWRGDEAPVLWITAPGRGPGTPLPGHVEHAAVAAPGGRIDLAEAMRLLAARGINEVQAEAGAVLAGALLEAGLVDELLLYQAPLLLGDRGRPLAAGLDIPTMAHRRHFTVVESRAVGPDQRLLLRPRSERP